MAAACRPTAAIRTARSAPVCTAAQTSLLQRRGMRRLRPRALRVLGCCGGVQWLIEPSPALAGIITLHLLNVSTESEHDLIQVRSGSSRQCGPPAVADWTGLDWRLSRIHRRVRTGLPRQHCRCALAGERLRRRRPVRTDAAAARTSMACANAVLWACQGRVRANHQQCRGHVGRMAHRWPGAGPRTLPLPP
jgi:hypothetical protein